MILKTKKHNYNLYNTLLYLSRNLFFYSKIKLKDTFETRVYLIFFHFSIILTVFKNKKIHFSQQNYDNFFYFPKRKKKTNLEMNPSMEMSMVKILTPIRKGIPRKAKRGPKGMEIHSSPWLAQA